MDNDKMPEWEKPSPLLADLQQRLGFKPGPISVARFCYYATDAEWQAYRDDFKARNHKAAESEERPNA